jgi:hypothetical protein
LTSTHLCACNTIQCSTWRPGSIIDICPEPEPATGNGIAIHSSACIATVPYDSRSPTTLRQPCGSVHKHSHWSTTEQHPCRRTQHCYAAVTMPFPCCPLPTTPKAQLFTVESRLCQTQRVRPPHH